SQEFLASYTGLELPALPVQYKEFAAWQAGKEKREDIKKQETYWLEQFSGEIPGVNLPLDYPRPDVQSVEGGTVGFDWDSETTRQLKKLAGEETVTLYILLLTIFNILMSKLASAEDIVVGIPVVGRMHAELNRVIGFFVNTLAIRNYPRAASGFREFLHQVGERTLKAYDNQEYQFEELVDRVLEKRQPGRNPLFDAAFVFQNIDMGNEDVPQVELSE
ncbi:MAG: hypothetical protein GY765_08940, partial [bacterium]|nr:hypothetical protein [bacterium]